MSSLWVVRRASVSDSLAEEIFQKLWHFRTFWDIFLVTVKLSGRAFVHSVTHMFLFVKLRIVSVTGQCPAHRLWNENHQRCLANGGVIFLSA